ncbi:hypothetical protein WL88_01530 [Burkholderia diffusa]|uniref:Uncharacterized protein n=2 Tax=Burkholderia diffusa TaxID=488732 RepID=A0AAW3PGL7_9BURK|nr:hypothetical protein [Burkholderia diffusa]KVH43989.1 hypothetical protein WJ39_24890 [Burkholderia diffusa]KVM97361.1 hypothetical protein WJ62_20495 [Burkholderia diffusa]KWF39090.1 hypothetical protein WL86_16505 [Burkholderia diffusa]KWF42116.1 hypothetical protein WL85_03790 [Burkholderia diffusa]KWF53552.1 hypothetical protein WL88_01530 [Burkholderia diffusa]
MRTLFSRSCVQLTIAFALACPFMPARSEEGARPERAMLLADNAPRMQLDNRIGIVPVAAPQPSSSGQTWVTLWDELAPPAPVPIPNPVPLPGSAQHAMEGNAGNRIHQ